MWSFTYIYRVKRKERSGRKGRKRNGKDGNGNSEGLEKGVLKRIRNSYGAQN